MAASPHDVEGDALLVLAAQAGDHEAFSELFRRHYPTVRRACARKLRDLREADEIAQAAFVRAYERLDKCGGDRRFGAWVQVIANNLCIDHLRAAARTTPMDEPIDAAAATSGQSPEQALLNAEQAEMIQRALASLPDRQRDVVVARDVDGRRPPEIAAALGLSLGAVDSLLLRARRRLAASVQSMSAESGAANLMTTAAVSAAGGGAAHANTFGKIAEMIGNTVATVSYHVAVAAGMVPGMPSLAQQIAPAAAAGLVSLTPAIGTNVPDVPPVPAITATVPATPTAPSLPATNTDGVTESVPALPVPAAPTVAVDPTEPAAAPETSAPVATAPVAPAPPKAEAPTLLEQVGDATSGALRVVPGDHPSQ